MRWHVKLRYCHAQDFSKDEKRNLALQSRKAPPKYGSEAKQHIINSLHARMLAAQQVAGTGYPLMMLVCQIKAALQADACLQLLMAAWHFCFTGPCEVTHDSSEHMCSSLVMSMVMQNTCLNAFFH